MSSCLLGGWPAKARSAEARAEGASAGDARVAGGSDRVDQLRGRQPEHWTSVAALHKNAPTSAGAEGYSQQVVKGFAELRRADIYRKQQQLNSFQRQCR